MVPIRYARAMVAGCAAITTACAPAIRSDRDETVPIPLGAGWAWGARDAAPQDPFDPILGNAIVRQRFVRAIEAAMEAKGFRLVDDTAAADFVLAFHLGTPEPARGARPRRIAYIGLGLGWGRYGRYGGWGSPWYPGLYTPWGWASPVSWAWAWAPWLWYSPGHGGLDTPWGYAGRYGSLVLELEERSTGRVAWRGQYDLDAYDAQGISQGRIEEMVGRLLAGLH